MEGRWETFPRAIERPRARPFESRRVPHGGMNPGRLRDWVALLRPHQWVKNAFVLAPLVFSGRATDPGAVAVSLAATALFCALASGIYALNDAWDHETDRVHPLKRSRPVASGRIPRERALRAGLVLASAAVGGAFVLAPGFGAVAGTYLVFNVVYTTVLKSVVILDVFAIASFFLLRLVGGSLVIGVQPSIWLLLCGGLLALYLGFTKRRHEIATLGTESGEHRAVLVHYSPEFLDQMSSVLLSVTVVAYIMYTFTSETADALGTDLLTYSVVFVLYGVFRYLYLVHRREAGSPTETLLSDGPLLVNVALWLSYCAWVIYYAG